MWSALHICLCKIYAVRPLIFPFFFYPILKSHLSPTRGIRISLSALRSVVICAKSMICNAIWTTFAVGGQIAIVCTVFVYRWIYGLPWPTSASSLASLFSSFLRELAQSCETATSVEREWERESIVWRRLLRYNSETTRRNAHRQPLQIRRDRNFERRRQRPLQGETDKHEIKLTKTWWC